jgi:hypothetical protein
MPETSLEQAPASVYTILATFRWGASSVVRYCRWTSDVVSNGQTFTHEPTLKCFVNGFNRGGTEDNPCEIEMRMSRAPFSTLVLPFAHSKVECDIEELVPGTDSTRKFLYRGKLSKIIAKPSGAKQLARAKVVGIKSVLKGTLGVQALSTCVAPFGSEWCGFDADAVKETVTISEINTDGVPNRIKITTAASLNPLMWTRGWFEVDGLRIVIRRCWNDAGKRFDLREIPPPSWATASAVLWPGCTKTIEACRFHDREESFSGYGYGMPNRNPLYQEPL